MPFVVSIILGFIFGRYVYKTYINNLYDALRSSKLYLVEKGEYNSVNEMRGDNDNIDYVYYKDNDKYKMVVGITKDYDNVKKIESLYDGDLSVLEYYIANDNIDSRQDEYEKELFYASEINDVKEAVNNILNLYKR